MIAEPSKSKSENVSTIIIGKGDTVRVLKVSGIFGANASGKSGLLRGLFEMSKFLTTIDVVGSKISAYDPFAFSEETKNSPVEFWIDFVIDNIKYSYSISFSEKQILHEKLIYFPKNKSTDLFSRKVPEQKDILTHIGIIGRESKNKTMEVFNNQTILSKFGRDIPNEIISKVFLYFKNIDIVNAVNSRMLTSFSEELMRLCYEDRGLLNNINKVLSFVDTGINSVDLSKKNNGNNNRSPNISSIISTRNFEILGLHNYYKGGRLINQSSPLPFAEESEGTKKLFILSGILLNAIKNGQAVFVDELDSGLHPYVIKVLIALFQNENINTKNAQLIFTAQDMNLLDRYVLRKDQICLVEKNAQGITNLFSLQDFSDVREDTPFEKWYLAGKFGAIPKIQSMNSLSLN
jgi:AAA15 family ATPase/GTPase